MSDSNDRDNYVSPAEGRTYTLFKWLILALLAILLTMLLGRSCQYAGLAAPTLAGPGTTVDAGPVILRGDVDARAQGVAIDLNGESIGTATVSPSGTWELTTVALPAGEYEAIATTIDADGQRRASSAPVRFTIADPVVVVPPGGEPSNGQAAAEVPPTLVIPTVDDPAAVRLQGTGTPGTTVRVLRDGIAVGSTAVDADGNWELTSQVVRYATSFVAVDDADDGREIGRTAEVLVLVPEMAAPLRASGTPKLEDTELASDGQTRGTLTWNGTGEPRTAVALVAGARDLGRANVAPDGTWSFEGEVMLAPGEYDVTAQMVDAQNNLLNEQTALLTIPDIQQFAEPVAPTIDPFAESVTPGRVTVTGSGTPNSELVLTNNGVAAGQTTVGPDGRWAVATDVEAYVNRFEATGTLPDGTDLGLSEPVTALAPLAARPLATDGDPALGAFSRAGSDPLRTRGVLNWRGSGEAGATVEIINEQGDVLSSTTVGDDGTWQVNQPIEAPAGDYMLRARQVGPDGSVLGESEAIAVSLPSVSGPTVGGALTGGLIDDLVELRGTAVPSSEVDLLLDGTLFATVPADANGIWRYSTPLVAGRYVIAARSAGLDGEVATSSPVSLTIDVETAGPAIDTVDGDPATGSYEMSGRAPAGATVEILVDGVVVDSATADESGKWRYGGTATVGNAYQLSARTLADGDSLAVTTLPRTFSLGGDSNEAASTAVNVTSVVPGAAAKEVAFSGQASAGAAVQVILDNGINPATVVDTVTADADGVWRYSAILEPGLYRVTARELDASNVPVLASSARPFIVGNDTDGNQIAGSDAGLLRVVYRLPAVVDAADDGGATTDTGDSATTAETTLAVEAPAIALIVDASWSMTLDLGGNTRLTANNPDSRIAQAKAALDAMLDVIPQATPVAVRAFGNIEGNLSCRTDLMLPLTDFDAGIVGGVLDGIVPQNRANTAIAVSLDAIADDLAGADGPKVAVLLTDGEETCGGDPLAAVQRLVDAGIDLQLNIVGFALADQALKDQFAEMAEITGGQYFDAADTATLTGALARAVGVPYTVRDTAGEDVADGVIGGTPILLPPGDYTVAIVLDETTIEESVTVRAGLLTTVLPQ